ncbi:hypothetical protein HDV00_009976 [Rhizophlyctis rosea]|nr:hypothetical protein HDV00_009976 [Rhizophlyctis rosea]
MEDAAMTEAVSANLRKLIVFAKAKKSLTYRNGNIGNNEKPYNNGIMNSGPQTTPTSKNANLTTKTPSDPSTTAPQLPPNFPNSTAHT